jgi:hypothetical protein
MSPTTFIAPTLDATARDFDTLRARLVELAQRAFPGWSDGTSPDALTVLLELFAFVGDILGQYQDQLGRESRLATATQRQNVIALCQMLGYRLHGAAAAPAVVEFALARVPSVAVTIPAGTVLTTRDRPTPLRFSLLAPVTIVAGQDPPRATGLVEHSETFGEQFDAVGAPYLEVDLGRAPYLDRSARVTDAAGPWTEVDTFLGSGADRHVVVAVDGADRALLRFGDGRNGLPPSGTLAVTYQIGGGARGNVPANAITEVETPVADAHGVAVTVHVTNPLAATGGVDRETLAQAKLLAPRNLRATDRSVTRDDFVAHALDVPGVARALMLTSNEDPTILENSGDLVVVPQGGGAPTPALLDAVLDQITVVHPATLTFQVRTLPAIYRSVSIAARLYLQPGAAPADVARRIRDGLAAFFAPSLPDGTPNPSVAFGLDLREPGEPAGRIAWSDIADLIVDTRGVRKLGPNAALDLTLNGQAADVDLGRREFPALGVVTLVRADTGETL